MNRRAIPRVTREEVIRLWFNRQGLSDPRGSIPLSADSLVDHLERTGALQLDSVNVLDRAHYITLWSRFGIYDRRTLDKLVYQDRLGYEYWGHEASILPLSHLPLGMRRMSRFPPRHYRERAFWAGFKTSAASKKRVLKRVREEGPRESADFTRADPVTGKEDAQSLKLLWHAGRLAIHSRRHFRCVYELADRVYPDVQPASSAAFEDSWLLGGLAGNGIATESHLTGYFTAPELPAGRKRAVIKRNLKSGTVVRVHVEGDDRTWLARPEDLDGLRDVPPAGGTNLLCPFDSFLWQRDRAEELLGFRYRIEIYVPAAKRVFGYYMLPILHDGQLVGRLEPKFHRDRSELEVRSLYFEDGFEPDPAFTDGLNRAIESLCSFVGADSLTLPRNWPKRGIL